MSHRLSSPYTLVAGLVAIVAPATALAYVGPGAGITAIGSVLALLAGVVLAIVGFIWYPIKRFIARFRSDKTTGDDLAEKNTAEETGNGKKT